MSAGVPYAAGCGAALSYSPCRLMQWFLSNGGCSSNNSSCRLTDAIITKWCVVMGVQLLVMLLRHSMSHVAWGALSAVMAAQ
jgi:hypothetical protein